MNQEDHFGKRETRMFSIGKYISYFGVVLLFLEIFSRFLSSSERDWAIGLSIYVVFSGLFVAWSASFFKDSLEKVAFLISLFICLVALSGLGIAFFYNACVGVILTFVGVIGLIYYSRTQSKSRK